MFRSEDEMTVDNSGIGNEMLHPKSEVIPLDSDDLAGYATMLAFPRSHCQFVPDFETRPSILTDANISENYPIEQLRSPSSSRIFLIVLPRFAQHSTIVGTIENNLTLNWASLGYAALVNAPAILTGAYPIPNTYIRMSRVFANSYTFLRPIASVTQVSSSTTSTTSAALSGILHAAAFNDLNDFTTFASAEVGDVCVTTKDSIQNAPINLGIAYTPGPEILQPFTNPVGLPNIGDITTPVPSGGFTSYVTTTVYGVSQISYQTELKQFVVTGNPINAHAFFPLACSRVNLGSTLQVDVKCRLSAAILTNTISIYLYGIRMTPTGQVIFPFRVATLAPGTANTNTSLSDVIDLTDQISGTTYMLLPYVSLTTSATLPPTALTADSTLEIIVSNLGQGDYRSSGPGACILAESVGNGQTLQITQKVNYEAVPNGALSKDVKTSTYAWRNRDPIELTVAEAAFNSSRTAIRRIYYGLVYSGMTDDLTWQRGISKSGIMREASFWSSLGNIAKGVGKVASVALPMVASAFGPQYAPLGQAAGSIVGALSSIGDRQSAGLVSARASARMASRKRRLCYATPFITLGARQAAGSTWAPLGANGTTHTIQGNIKPGNQATVSQASTAAETKITAKLQNVLTGHKNPGPKCHYAIFPTVTVDGALLEKIFVTDFPIHSIEVTEDKQMVETDTVYTQISYSLTHANGERVASVFVSQDFENEELGYAVAVLAYFGLDQVYLTATTPGKIVGNSFMLALAAACMELPPVAALTGALEVRDYPYSCVVSPVGDIQKKFSLASQMGYKLIAPIKSLTVNKKFLGLENEAVIAPPDIVAGYTGNGDWGACGVETTSDLILALTSIVMSAPRIKTQKDYKGEPTHTFQPYPITAAAPTEISLAVTAEQARALVDPNSDTCMAIVSDFLDSVDPKKKLKPNSRTEFTAGLLASLVKDIEEWEFKGIEKGYKLADLADPNLEIDKRDIAGMNGSLKKAPLFIHLLLDRTKGLKTIEKYTKTARKNIEARIKEDETTNPFRTFQIKAPVGRTDVSSLFTSTPVISTNANTSVRPKQPLNNPPQRNLFAPYELQRKK
jgi:hypothetical protein